MSGTVPDLLSLSRVPVESCYLPKMSQKVAFILVFNVTYIFICAYVCVNLPNGCEDLVDNWQI